jgi:hypothetical protein
MNLPTIKVTLQCPLCGHTNRHVVHSLDQLEATKCSGCGAGINVPLNQPYPEDPEFMPDEGASYQADQDDVRRSDQETYNQIVAEGVRASVRRYGGRISDF